MDDGRARIVHLISTTGSGFYFRALADHVNRDQFDVSLVTLPPAGQLNTEMADRGLRSLALNCRGSADYPRAVLQLAGWLKHWRTDVLQVHLFEASLVGLLAARLAGTPVTIFTGHHSHELMLTRKALPLFADTVCSRWLSRYVIVHCQQMKDDLVRVEGVLPEKIAVIPLGFDLAQWKPTPGARERIRREFGLNSKAVFGAIGRFFWVKDYPRLLHAFRPIAAAHPDPVLLLLGDGPDRAAVESLAAQLLPPGRVVFAGERNDVSDCLAAMDLFVHPAISESFCQVIVEAQIAGLPLVSTAVGIAPELIANGVNGFVVPPKNTEALTGALTGALSARDRWTEMGQEGRRRCQRFAIDATIAAHERQYLSWLTERRGPNSNRLPIEN